MNFIPNYNTILVKANPVAKEKGGLIIPDTIKEKPSKSTVVKIGEKAKDFMMLKEGDVILHSKHAGSEIEIENEKYLLMRYSDVLGTI